jgi:hypothetical protein
MKLPISYKDFAKDPVKGLLFIVLLAVGYLYYDNKASYKAQNEEYKGQYNNCNSRVEMLEVKLEKTSERLRKTDSIMSAALAKLEILNEINNIK